MLIYFNMKDIKSILEIDKIIEEIGKYLKTSIGGILLENIKVFPSKEILNIEFSKLNEMFSIINNYKDIPLNGDLIAKEVLDKAKKGSYLDEIELNKIKDEMFLTFEIIRFFKQVTIETPFLTKLVKKMVYVDSLYKSINSKISKENKVFDNATPRLKDIRYKLSFIDKEIHKQIIQLAEKYNTYLVNDSYVLRNGHFALAVNSSDKSKIDGVVHDLSDSGQTTFIEPTVIVNLENQKQILIIQEKDEVNKILKELTNECIKYEDTIFLNNKIIGQFDLLTAKVKYAINNNAVIPQISEKQEVYLIDARHPLIDPDKAVSNTFIMDEIHPMMLISGPNAGGKTIALKTVAMLSYLAKLGIPITCSPDSRIAYFKNIFVNIGDNQSIESNLSTFSAHISDLSVVIKYITSRDLVVIDELGSGTDPKEGDALSIAVVKFLLQKKCISMITSHFSLLKKYGLSNPKIINASFLFNQELLEPTFKMLLGVSGKSFGFLIARKFGLPYEIINEAKKIYKKNYLSETDIKIESIENKEQELIRREESLKEEENKISSLESELKTKEKLLNEKEEKLKAKKIEEFDDLIDSKIDEINNIYDEFLEDKQNKIKETEEKLNSLSLKEKKDENFAVGDYVYVKSLNEKGKITRIKGNKITFNDESGFTLTTTKDYCEKIDEPVEKLTSTRNIDKELSSLKPLSQSLNLVGYHLDEGISALDQYLDSCVLRKYKEVRIIHGYGSGQLRNAIHNYLKKSSYVSSFKLGDESNGGSGSTIVYLK